MNRSFLFLLLATGAIAFGQNGNSPLSRFGIGELAAFSTVQQRSMGNVTIPFHASDDISMANPAAWTAIQNLRLQGDLSYEYESYSTSGLSYGNIAIKGLQFALPVEESYRTRIIGGFIPLSRVSYEVLDEGSAGGERYRVEYLGSGGITVLRFGVAAEPVTAIHVGLAYHYHIGTINRDQNISFDNTLYYPTNQTVSTAHAGSGFHIGALYSGIDKVTLGISARTPATITTTRNTIFRYLTHDSTVSNEEGRLTIPLHLGFGAAYSPLPGVRVAADYTLQDWTGTNSDGGKQNVLGNAYRIGAGIEWNPHHEETAGFLNYTIYRIGFYQQASYIQIGNDQENEFFLTAGIGIPIFSRNQANLSLEYGWRGEDGTALGRRTVLRASLSIGVGEPWFVRRQSE